LAVQWDRHLAGHSSGEVLATAIIPAVESRLPVRVPLQLCGLSLANSLPVTVLGICYSARSTTR
jgi:hypothetical protein